ncbi:BT4734/BF3469 family protein [Bacteroides rodentium]|uniref:BT4734/BF3469 family protein n=1 Tax=Bacteroides rodentium TaxID=691816 RepID=UPI00046E8567|nr:BT4734/BF3469 family protein [Bacteroides rodentium]
MEKMFDVEISIYRNVFDNVGTSCKLSTFLFSSKHRAKIEYLRTLPTKKERDKVKMTLPSACISGVFHPIRKQECLKRHTGFICVDIDAKDNPSVTDWEALKRELSILPQIAYISLSVSGNGLFLLIPISYKAKHLQHFKAMQKDFKDMGIIIDPACSDVSRMRVISYDESSYINEGATEYKKLLEEPKPTLRKLNYNVNVDDTFSRIYSCLQEIQSFNIDITQGYNRWYEVGCSLASLGEAGREIFHAVSSLNDKYRYADADKKFSNLLATTHAFTIGTFFAICEEYGISYKKV